MIDTLRRSPLLIALAVAAVVLAALLAFEVRLATPARGTAAPAGARPVDAKLLPPIPARPPEQAYPEVTNRPLFISTRRPAPEVAAATPAPAMRRGQFQLQGVIVHGQQRTAMLRERSTGKVLRAEAGQELNGMRVAEIQPESVTLTLGDEREEVPLIVQRASGAPGQVVAVPGQPLPAAAAAAAGAGAGPFARAPGPGVSPFPPREQPPGASPGQPQPAPGQPGLPPPVANTAPPPASTAGAPPAAGNVTASPPPPAAGPAFPMSPEELLARRRARRAQQNQ